QRSHLQISLLTVEWNETMECECVCVSSHCTGYRGSVTRKPSVSVCVCVCVLAQKTQRKDIIIKTFKTQTNPPHIQQNLSLCVRACMCMYGSSSPEAVQGGLLIRDVCVCVYICVYVCVCE